MLGTGHGQLAYSGNARASSPMRSFSGRLSGTSLRSKLTGNDTHPPGSPRGLDGGAARHQGLNRSPDCKLISTIVGRLPQPVSEAGKDGGALLDEVRHPFLEIF